MMKPDVLPRKLKHTINRELTRIRFSTFFHTEHSAPWSSEAEKMERAGVQSLFELPPRGMPHRSVLREAHIPTCQCCPFPATDITTQQYNAMYGCHKPTYNATRPGVALDPFFGSGTVGVVAKKFKRDYVGIELNPDYAEMARKRLDQTQPALFAR